MPFILCKLEMSEKKFKHTKGSIIRYDSIKFGIQEFFVQLENSLFSDNVRFVVEIMKAFSLDHSADDRMAGKEDYRDAKQKFRRQVCAEVDASQGVSFDEETVDVKKVSFGTIWITSIKVSVTMKIKQRQLNFDLTDPQAMFGLLTFLAPFISRLASITDSVIKLDEIMIVEGCINQDRLIRKIT